jgi:uncharacterized protein YecE (DUF72 family)
MSATARIRIGIGGWIFEPWRGTFYPDKLPHKRELNYASRCLTSIEIDGTYYRSQTPETFARWRDETPDGFVFALKAPRYATNRKSLADARPSIERFFASGVTELGPKLGPINWQFLPTKKFDREDFETFFQMLPQSVDGLALRHAVEVRHNSFRTDEFISLARSHGAAIVIAGDSKYPQIADLTAPFVYARIMGASNGEELGYSRPALTAWARRAKTWAEGGSPPGLSLVGSDTIAKPREVFLYVINGYKARNPAAAMALIERLK